MKSRHIDKPSSGEINYLVLAAMFTAILFYAILNLYEPQIDRQYDFFELMFPLSEFVAAGFCIVITKKYWGSKVFGRAYLSLSIGLICAGIGTALFGVFEVMYGIDNPFPNWNDIFNASYFFFVFYHLISCTRYFKKKFSKTDKLLIVTFPLTAALILLGVNLFTVEIPGSVPDLLSRHIQVGDTTFKLVQTDAPSSQYQNIVVDNVTYHLVPANLTTTRYEQEPITDSPVKINPIVISNTIISPIPYEDDPVFWVGVGLQAYYFSMTTLNLAVAIIAAQFFRNTILGNAWGLLLLGIALAAIGDIIYYARAIETYDRTSAEIVFWVFGYMIISYALYLHRKRL